MRPENERMIELVLRCYAEGRDGDWEAICLDLDIAVQGSSRNDVVAKLEDAIELYIDSLSDLPESDRVRLLRRPVPLGLRLKIYAKVLRAMFSRHRHDDSFHAQFDVPAALARA